MTMHQHVKEFIDAYAESVVWTSLVLDDEGEGWYIDQLPEASREGYINEIITHEDVEDVTHRIKTHPGVIQDCERFIAGNYDTLKALIEDGSCPDWASHGHDFHLTRDHHGAGFWDRGYGEAGDLLTERAEEYGENSHEFWVEDNTIGWAYNG